MLRVAATLLALLAVLPAVTPLLGGYKLFSECRNLTHVGPGKWPQTPSKPYNFTGLLVMPKTTCSCSLVTATFLLSCSLCRLWKDNVDISNDIEEDGSEVRLGPIQGEVSPKLYQRRLVKQYHHCKKDHNEILKNPLMLIEVQEPFDGWTEENYPGYFRNTPASQSSAPMLVDVVGYENSVNLPIYHQAVFDAYIVVYNTQCKKYGKKLWDLSGDAVCTWDVSPVRTVCNIDRGGPIVVKKNVLGIIIGFVDDTLTNCKTYGRTKWNLSEEAICTWDVSPVRTVCNIDRGGPVLFRRFVLGIIVGIVDDMETPSNYCGEGRVHYNVFFQLREYADWMKAVTGGEAKFFNLLDGKILEDSTDDYQQGGLKPEANSPQPRRTAKKPSKGRSAAGQHVAAVGPLLLTTATAMARLANHF